MTISFPPRQAFDFERLAVSFTADIDGNQVLCRISVEALEDNYGCNGVEPVGCFQSNRYAIEAKAASLIDKKRFETDGSILIRSADGP